ncbi:hypothetical protein Tco_0729043 [Tanacetum coccineum]|uniref:No apical meristem-associated C-terminal domain-containing protein n=1 Tax=Tanacetum coccineum TaxID=301880 RepID=A0ABQ4YQG3_9ASTR
MASSSNRRGATQTTLPWTTAEEITLCTAWCNAMDTYVTRDKQFSKGFWEEVYANFKKDMGGIIRGYDAIVSKWKNSIRPKVACFSVVYDSVRRMDENGFSDLVLFQNALAEFQTGYGKPFTIEACWRILKNHPTWSEVEVPTYQRPDEHEICPYLTEKEYQQLLLDEAAFKEHLEEEAKAEKERAIYDKELEEFLKAEQSHDELFRMEFGVKSDSEYETD